ncbi:YggT family protein [Holzapfeliella floricola]|uniref:YggT family protein n=1 Tax=Holzapfeliella floricola TaxID=679249 RepID=UPI0007055AEA|nr:YggT family protein [Holzapfeliella floricola]
MADFIIFIYKIIHFVLNIYSILIIIDALLSWVPALKNGSLGRLLGKLVDPYIGTIERYVPAIGGISFAPVIGVFVLYLAQNYVLPNFFLLIWRLLG